MRRRGFEPRYVTWVVWGVALVARLVVTWVSAPSMSDDIWRYIHDGRMLGLKHVNPYRWAPAEVDPDFAGNNRQLVSIYQPTSQWVFAGCALVTRGIHGLSFSPDDAARMFRLCFVGFDMVVVGLLLGRLRHSGHSGWWAALYGWHPLVVVEVAGSGHQDPIGIVFVLIALWMCERSARSNIGGVFASGMALAGAVAVKPLVIPLILPMAWTLRRRPRCGVSLVFGLCMTLAVLYVPFALMDGGLDRMFETARTFVDKWSFNGSLHALAEGLLGQKFRADAMMAGLLAVIIVGASWRLDDLWRTAGVYFLAAILVSSTVHPWYLLWALAFVPLRFSVATWLFGLTIGWRYWVFLEQWRTPLPAWLLWAEYVPVYGAVGWGLVRFLIFDFRFWIPIKNQKSKI